MSAAGSSLALRRAGPEDAGALCKLHVAVWRATYADLAPPKALAALDEAHRLPGWRAHLEKVSEGEGTIMAEVAGALAGFVRYGPASQPELGHGGEIKHLYVDPAHAGQGIGRALLRAGLDALREVGQDVVCLAVVEGNIRALRFYKAMGGVEAGRFRDAGPLWKSENLILRWPVGERTERGME
ncbi:GNAT family N-acetyltransferase [Rhodalgimonas zhirmunskyi]|uniref:GNAT family N-acetyltransferase n=1 Tax=Rhodalgimonas zhirmunskyi TaxID=2964767 RepID=A0AAJ1U9I9_9RHOB|nr:GNAT family N-acetyltransferase [Rhodoalgimonas zhirmunskyi]MDQ2095806.1 GNAT family N-acetyltransferase [Rhodoalgimonas zhirmunskyi]